MHVLRAILFPLALGAGCFACHHGPSGGSTSTTTTTTTASPPGVEQPPSEDQTASTPQAAPDHPAQRGRRPQTPTGPYTQPAQEPAEQGPAPTDLPSTPPLDQEPGIQPQTENQIPPR
jgi:hypothetical protein